MAFVMDWGLLFVLVLSRAGEVSGRLLPLVELDVVLKEEGTDIRRNGREE